MKNSRSGEKIKLTSIDELLGVVNEESAMEIEINAISPFKAHPFKVIDDEKIPYLSAAFAGDDRNGTPLWRNDRTHLERRGSEVIVVPDDGSLDHKELKEMVNEINHTQVAPEERLTDEVYHYDTKERVFEKADRFQQRKLDQAIDGVKDAVKERLQTPKHKATEISL